ncbi:MAG: energy transducer TonB [Blastocatellia bacterium]
MFNRRVIHWTQMAVVCIFFLAPFPARCRAAFFGAQVSEPSPMGLEKAAQLAAASVVVISSTGANGNSIVQGAGFFVRKDIIATAYDVIKDGRSFKVQMNGQPSEAAVVVGVDQSRSVALLVTDQTAGTPLRVRYEHGPGASREGFEIVLADGQAIKCQLTTGGRSVTVDGDFEGSYLGSPILNQWGEAIGLAELSNKAAQGRLIPISAISQVGGIVMAGSKEEIEAEAIRQTTLANDTPLPGAEESETGIPDSNGSGMPRGTVRFERRESDRGESDREGTSLHSEMLRPTSLIRKTERTLRESVLREAQPLYPRRAKRMGVIGRVRVEVTIDRWGYVTHARAVSGPPPLWSTAIAAAMAHLFDLTIVDGQAVAVVGPLTFTFQGRGSAQPSVMNSANRRDSDGSL